MKIKILSLSALLTVALGLCLSVTSTPALPKNPETAAVPAAAPSPAAAPPALPEPHPEIREAIASLRRAKDHLNMPPTTLADTAWKPSEQRMKRSGNCRIV